MFNNLSLVDATSMGVLVLTGPLYKRPSPFKGSDRFALGGKDSGNPSFIIW